ncbi:uncharacterized protein LOC115980769 [Quercus lobata]|uniref:uncharacterized protein LOC115980769 n=1 Tax=Quercus lobata TaxID=97700 RepID=UPI0012490E30|nr:uncharacterized protein LOC115980769 [Quercus lobata]
MKNVELMASVMWTIWHCRNQVQTSSKEYPLSQVISAASQALATFHDSISVTPKQSLHNVPTQIRWSPPSVGTVKVNFSRAIFKDIRKVGIGMIVRDSNGQAIASLSEQTSLPFSPEIAEAMAATRAISFVQDLGFTSFILEGDSVNVINTLNSDEKSLSNYGHVLSSAKSMLVASSCVSFSHVRRAGNCVAHNLAKHARHVRGFTVWTEDVPPHLNSVFLADHD